MLRKTKLVNFICAIMIGILLMLAVVSILFFTGVISLDKADLIISTGSADAKYDGTPLTNRTWNIEYGSLKDGHTLTFSFNGAQTNVGESDNSISIVITDELGADVTGDYKIQYNLGKLKINPRIVLLTYDEDAESSLSSNKFNVSDMYDGLVFGHKIVVKPAQNTSLTDPDAPAWNVSIFDEFGGDVTYNYQVMMSSVTNEEETTEEEETNDENELFKITSESDAKVYLKEQSYGNYNGNFWNNAYDYYTAESAEWSTYYLAASTLLANGAQKNKLNITSLCGKYALPYYTTIGDGHQTQFGDVCISGDASTPYSVEYINFDPDLLIQDYANPSLEEEYRKYVYENYLDLKDQETYEYIHNIIAAEGFDRNDINIINDVAAYISNAAEYNLDYSKSLDESNNIVIDFLDAYKQGVCKHFATAAVLLYRALGIPARYTDGVAVDVLQNQTVIAGKNNRHAWVEVYVDSLGWVCVEVTGMIGVRSTPVGVVDGISGMGNGAGAGAGNGGDQSLADQPPVNKVLYYITTQYDASSVYLREGSSGNYNGKSWLSAPEFPYTVQDTYSASYLPSFALENAAMSSQIIRIEPAYSSFALPYYTAPRSEYNTFEAQTSDVYYSGEYSSYTVAYYNTDYRQFNELQMAPEAEEFEAAYRLYVYETYLSVDDGPLKDYLNNVIAENDLSDEDVFVLISRVATYIQACAKYNLDYDRSIDKCDDIVLAFLNQKEGVCRHFASAATLMFRLLGVPARYTYGAVGSAKAGVRTEVKSQTAHAWVEVYIDGIGWIQVEVTPGYSDGEGGTKGTGGPGPGGSGTDVEIPGELSIIFKNRSLYYNRSEQTYPFDNRKYAYIKGFDNFEALGYTYEFIGERSAYIEPGKYWFDLTDIRFYSPQGEDISDIIKANYDITTQTIASKRAELTITRPIIINGGDFEKLYDGKPFDFSDPSLELNPTVSYVYDENISEDHTFEVSYTCAGYSANISLNKKHQIKYKVKVYDGNGNDISSEYGIYDSFGYVSIKPINICITSGSKTLTLSEYEEYKAENGEDAPLVCHEYTLTYDDGNGNMIPYELPENHSLNVEFSAGLSKRGSTANSITYSITVLGEDEKEYDASANFLITKIEGMLRITGNK